jgi:FMN-dependent NADH-azoreductase
MKEYLGLFEKGWDCTNENCNATKESALPVGSNPVGDEFIANFQKEILKTFVVTRDLSKEEIARLVEEYVREVNDRGYAALEFVT